jgi:RecJ-like exonuclease
MLCPHCHGTRWVTLQGQRMPCPECAGVGEVHCCDGLQEQIDPATEPVVGPATCETKPAAPPGRDPA